MFFKKKIEPQLDDIYGFFSAKDYAMFTWKSESTFRTIKQRWGFVIAYIPMFVKWDIVRYKRVFIPKKDICIQ